MVGGLRGARSAAHAFSPQQALEILARVMDNPPDHVAFLNVDWLRLAAAMHW